MRDSRFLKIAHAALWMAGLLLFLLSALISAGCFAEFFSVLYDDSGYRWTTEGPNGWNYETRELYLASMMTGVVIFLPLAMLFAWSLYKRALRPYLWAWGMFAVLLLYNQSPLDRTVTYWLAEFMPTKI